MIEKYLDSKGLKHVIETLQSRLNEKQSKIQVNPIDPSVTLTGLTIDGVSYKIEGGGSGTGIQKVSSEEEIENICTEENLGNYVEFTGDDYKIKLLHDEDAEVSLDKAKFDEVFNKDFGAKYFTLEDGQWYLTEEVELAPFEVINRGF